MKFPNKSLNLTWEKNSEDRIGILIPTKKIVTPVLLKKIAVSKMTNISLITGEFCHSSVSFAPLFWVLMDASSSVDFLGVYAADILELDLESEHIIVDKNEKHKNTPLICIRKAAWNKEKDLEYFKLADDKTKYILSELQIKCDVFFPDTNQGISILRSIIPLINFWKNGVAFEKSSQRDTMHEEIKIGISDSNFSLNFSYNPYLINSETWDNLLKAWCEYFNELQVNSSCIPDDNFRVSYHLSVLEQIGISMG
jgi:hypothetical protein